MIIKNWNVQNSADQGNHQGKLKIQPKYSLRFAFISILLLYSLVSLPLTAVFLVSDRLRFTYFEIIAGGIAQIEPLKYVFIGDSITKAGDNWGWQLEQNPSISKNLAVNGYTTRQVRTKVSEALGYSPRYLFILAGTNDSRNQNITIEQTIREYEQLLDTVAEHNTQPIITLVPLQSQQYQSANIKVEQINQALNEIAQERQITLIDLNPIIAPEGYLLSQYTNDGVHFTEAAYQVWRHKINDFLTTQANSNF
ncbi:MAG: GDSL-type esterase/lipase family protein [Cyanobacteria bacterium J06600_6]